MIDASQGDCYIVDLCNDQLASGIYDTSLGHDTYSRFIIDTGPNTSQTTNTEIFKKLANVIQTYGQPSVASSAGVVSYAAGGDNARIALMEVNAPQRSSFSASSC
jgi:hypothetical protein